MEPCNAFPNDSPREIKNVNQNEISEDWKIIVPLLEALENVEFDLTSTSWKPMTRATRAYDACKKFIMTLSSTATRLNVLPLPRDYRRELTKNYRPLFPDGQRHYRIDVLEAAQEGYSMIWVNGERFEFGISVISTGIQLKQSWNKLIALLKMFQLKGEKASCNWKYLLISELHEIDMKWAAFEQEYIFELIQIERRARRFVTDLIAADPKLHYLTQVTTELLKYKHLNQIAANEICLIEQWKSWRKDYVNKLFRLNAVANQKRKGRADLDSKILDISDKVLECIDKDSSHIFNLFKTIALSCIEKFNEFRNYLTLIARHPEKIDPHLCNNSTLVNHLESIEESWERAYKFLVDKSNIVYTIQLSMLLLEVFDIQKHYTKLKKSLFRRRSSSPLKCNIRPGGQSALTHFENWTTKSCSNIKTTLPAYDKLISDFKTKSEKRSCVFKNDFSSLFTIEHSHEFDRNCNQNISTSNAIAKTQKIQFADQYQAYQQRRISCFKNWCETQLNDITSFDRSYNSLFYRKIKTVCRKPKLIKCQSAIDLRFTWQQSHDMFDHKNRPESQSVFISPFSILRKNFSIEKLESLLNPSQNVYKNDDVTALFNAVVNKDIRNSRKSHCCGSSNYFFNLPTADYTSSTSGCGSHKINGSRETLEDSLLAYDVGSFLAVPRLLCLFYLMDPLKHYPILAHFLPQYFESNLYETIYSSESLLSSIQDCLNLENSSMPCTSTESGSHNGSTLASRWQVLRPFWWSSLEQIINNSATAEASSIQSGSVTEKLNFKSPDTVFHSPIVSCCNYGYTYNQNSIEDIKWEKYPTHTKKDFLFLKRNKAIATSEGKVYNKKTLSNFFLCQLQYQLLRYVPPALHKLIESWIAIQVTCTEIPCAAACSNLECSICKSLRPFSKNVKIGEIGNQHKQCKMFKNWDSLLICIIMRLCDDEEYPKILKATLGENTTEVEGRIEAIFQCIEEVSMSIQRHLPQDWNEFLHTVVLCLVDLQGFQKKILRRYKKNLRLHEAAYRSTNINLDDNDDDTFHSERAMCCEMPSTLDDYIGSDEESYFDSSEIHGSQLSNSVLNLDFFSTPVGTTSQLSGYKYEKNAINYNNLQTSIQNTQGNLLFSHLSYTKSKERLLNWPKNYVSVLRSVANKTCHIDRSYVNTVIGKKHKNIVTAKIASAESSRENMSEFEQHTVADSKKWEHKNETTKRQQLFKLFGKRPKSKSNFKESQNLSGTMQNYNDASTS